MGVHDPPGVRREGSRTDDPHVAGEDDDVGAGALERRGDRVVGAVGDQGRVDSLLGRPVQGGTGPIGEDEHDLTADLAARSRGMERAQVRPCARDRDGNSAGHRSSGPSM